jgi:predicted GIY-YIG superfamily endonuclease
MKSMTEALKAPHGMSLFSQNGVGKATILKKLGLSQDFQGCYVFVDDTAPVYVGISRSVIQRLIQHVKGKTHFDASLAYRMATFNYSHDMSRGEAMENEDFLRFFEEARKRLSSMKVAFIEVKSDVELYLFEVYCSMELDTAQWNSFKTH